ncbi:MAG: hypothetical protein H7Y11_09715 [Armatimonadetes bacterium]|nr:hypothetical protein [Anaerolineae bacterium]
MTSVALAGGRTWWLAPTYGMAAQVWRDFKRMFADVPSAEVSATEKRIDLPGGGSIAIHSAHTPDHLRGAGLDFAVLDEAAFMPAEIWSQVVRPTLVERGGGALFTSSPRGLNWFWDVYQLGLDPAETEWASFQFTAYDNPLIPPSELDTLKRSTPERVFAEEYLAQFLSETGRVFRGVQAAATASPDAQPQPGVRYVFGVDWAREADYTCIAVLDADTHMLVALDRFHQIGYELQRGRLRALYERWQPAVIWAEANSIGAVNIEALQADGLPVRPFMTTHSSKAPLIEGLALAIERRDIALLPDAVLLNELVSYTMARLPGGGFRYTAPSGGHDDCVIALALAWHGARYSGSSISFV